MANNLFLKAIIFSTVLFLPFIAVFADDNDPIPSDKSQVNSWFEKNVPPLASRKGTLDAALEAAEATPKVITVKQDGSGDFKTITDAVKSIPAGNKNRVIVKIGPGNYTEKVTIERNQPFVTFYGDPNDMPIIVNAGTASKYGTLDSSTLIVFSDYFSAVNIIVANSAPRPGLGVSGGQAVAMRITGDKASFYNCKFLGFQDTFCDDSGMHFLKDCYIEGTVDFVFGNGKTMYLNVELHVIAGDVLAIIAAQARHTAAEDTGYAFVHGSVTGATVGTALLGRGWMPYSRVAFVYTDLGETVHPKGWGDHPESENVFFGEYNCQGAGSKMDGRPAFAKKLGDAEAKPFLTLGFIQASKWLLPPAQV